MDSPRRAGAHALALLLGLGAGCNDYHAAPHPGLPQVVPRSASLLSPLKLVTLLAIGDPLADGLARFGGVLGGTAWWSAVGAEYGVGAAGAHVEVTGPPLAGTTITPIQIHDYIEAAAAAMPAAARDGNTLYLLYLPPGVAVLADVARGPNTDCKQFGGYHGSFGTRGDGFAVVQRCPALSGQSDLDTATVIASHEVIEAAVDTGSGYRLPAAPTGTPWHSDFTGLFALAGEAEVGDLCRGSYLRDGDYLLQRSWSNQRAAAGGDPCLPASSKPWNAASTEAAWYQVPGAGSQITVTGWSSGEMGSWPVRAVVAASNRDKSMVALHFTQSRYASSDQTDIENGGTATLQVGTSWPPGSWAVVFLVSYVVDSTSLHYYPDTDHFHVWPVGIYQP